MSAIPLSQLGQNLDSAAVQTSTEAAIVAARGTDVQRTCVKFTGATTDVELIPQPASGFRVQVLKMWISCAVAPSICTIVCNSYDALPEHYMAVGSNVFLGNDLGDVLFENPWDPDDYPLRALKTDGATLSFTIWWRTVPV